MIMHPAEGKGFFHGLHLLNAGYIKILLRNEPNEETLPNFGPVGGSEFSSTPNRILVD
jgi:hypothetical protein